MKFIISYSQKKKGLLSNRNNYKVYDCVKIISIRLENLKPYNRV